MALVAVAVQVPITAIAWSSPAATCDAASGGHHVALVVQHGDGSTVSKCVSFSGASLTGEQVLADSGVEYQTVDFGGLSAAVCQVDGEPAFFPPTCWATTSSSRFWEVFFARKGGGWASSNLGVSVQVFRDGDAEGFRYEDQSTVIAPTIMGNCPSPTPAPTATPKPTPRPTPRPTPSPSAGASASPTVAPPETLHPGAARSAPSLSPSQPPLGDVVGATASAGPSAETATAGSPPPASGSDDGSPALPIAILAIASLAGLAALRRRPGRSGPLR